MRTGRKERRLTRASGHDGAAIVIVLGLLAVLMLSGIAFSISMRVERRGAGNFRHTVRARHMIWSGLANAIEEIDQDVADTNDFRIYPDWPTFCSMQDISDLQSTEARVLSIDAAENIPDSLIAAAESERPYWRGLRSEIGGESQVIGRYAYVAVNCSGLLDANIAGGPHEAGTNPNQVVISSQLSDINDSGAFLDDRAKHVRYETLPEFAYLNGGLDTWPRNFCVYSRGRSDQSLDVANNSQALDKVYIGGDRASLEGEKTDIIQAFGASGVSRPGLAYSNLLDYVDEDSIPEKLSQGSVERVPMINEVLVAYNLAQGLMSGDYEFEWFVQTEWFYPFLVENESTDFQIAWTVDFEPTAQNSFAELVPPDQTLVSSVVNPGPGNRYGFVDVMDAASGNIPAMAGGPFTISFTAEIKAKVILDPAGDVVDAVPWPETDDGLILTIEMKNLTAPVMGQEKEEWTECIDPRFNWNDLNDRWVRGSDQVGAFGGFTPGSSIGSENKLAAYFLTVDPDAFGGAYGANADGVDMEMRVANGPLTSVGELGSLALHPWSTIRLYDHEYTTLYGTDPAYHSVFDQFAIYDPAANEFRRGLININSTNDQVLASAFFDAPKNELDPASDRFDDWSEALNVAGEIINDWPHTNLGSICSFNWADYVNGLTEFENEGPLRNSIELLTIRQNLFLIVIKAESYSEGVGGTVGTRLATAHGMAEVWRDPFADENGNHPMFIRLFKLLED